LLIAGYQTGISETCDTLFEMPKDPAGRCAVSVHYYTPSTFAILEEDVSWGKAAPTWGTDAEFKELRHYMTMMKTHFVDNGIPVIVGEYGCPKRNKDAASVLLYLSSVCKEAYDNQLCPVLWDVTGSHYDRENCRMYDQELREALVSVLEEEAR
jgi:endoglucanase